MHWVAFTSLCFSSIHHYSIKHYSKGQKTFSFLAAVEQIHVLPSKFGLSQGYTSSPSAQYLKMLSKHAAKLTELCRFTRNVLSWHLVFNDIKTMQKNKEKPSGMLSQRTNIIPINIGQQRCKLHHMEQKQCTDGGVFNGC